MSTELSAVLQNIVKRAASNQVEGPAAKMKARFTGATAEVVVLADCSSSMADFIGSSGISKFHHLQIALADILKGFPKIRLIAFGSYSKEIASAAELPDPLRGGLGGSTNLAGALEVAAKWKPQKTIIISDGLPDSEANATDAAQSMTGAIDTVYCGPDSHPAVQFLGRLARDTGGTPATWDGYKPIAGVIRGLLPAPAAIVTPAPSE